MTAESFEIRPVAHIVSDFSEKLGVPRQAMLVEALTARVVFTPEFRNADALRGIEGFSHLWLIWGFSENVRETLSPTVRPPRLGGNTRVGVFASRSPYRPNSLGLSCVRLISAELDGVLAPSLVIGGADMVNGTPVFDIKPYIPYADAHPEALSGFAPAAPAPLEVEISPALLSRVPEDKRAALLGVLAQDPRPAYQHDESRIYAMSFAGLNVSFTVGDKLTVRGVEKTGKQHGMSNAE